MEKILIKKFIVFLLYLGVHGCYDVSAQATISSSNGVIILNPNQKDDTKNSFKRGAYVGSHILGDSISYKLNEFEKAYVYYRPSSGAYAVDQKVVMKQDLYKKVKVLDKYYLDEVEKGRLTESEAERKFSLVLSKAIKLAGYNTYVVEKEIKKIKAPVEIEAYFMRIKFM